MQRHSTAVQAPRQAFSPGEWCRDPFDRTPSRIIRRLNRMGVRGHTRTLCDYVHGWVYGLYRQGISELGVPLSLTEVARVLGADKRTAVRVLHEVRERSLLSVETIDGRTFLHGADPAAPDTRLVVLPGGLDVVESYPQPPEGGGHGRPPPRSAGIVVPCGSLAQLRLKEMITLLVQWIVSPLWRNRLPRVH